MTLRLARRGHRVRVVTPRPRGPLPGATEAEFLHYPVSRRTPLETFATNALFGRFAVDRAIRGSKGVLVLSSYEIAFGTFALRRRPLAIPSVYIYHSRFHSDAVDRVAAARGLKRLLGPVLRRFVEHVERMVFASADAIVAVSPYSRAEIETRLGGLTPKVHVIPTGVDTDVFVPGDQRSARSTLGIDRYARVLLVVGRISPVKRYDRALETLRLLRDADSRYQLLVAGVGPELEALRELARRLGISSAVRFEGFLDGPALLARYQAADLQLCTSEYENWSLALLEALSCELPALGVPRGGIPELLGQISDDLVCAGAEPTDIADGVSHLFDRPEVMRVAGRRGRAVVVERYDWESVIDALERLFAGLIQDRGRGAVVTSVGSEAS